MKVVQLIDSLDPGGAERLAVTFANTLSQEIDGSFLCTTREEGLLKATIKKEVGYLFLNRRWVLDIRALFSFNSFIRNNQITIIHAHATSFFFATLAKILNPSLKIVWHDHYGKSEFLNERPAKALKICSYFFAHIFSVNQILSKWAEEKLFCKSTCYLQNIVDLSDSDHETQLKGIDGKRIICLANLRPQKDHINLLKAFQRTLKTYSEWTLHCVGKNFKDDYYEMLNQFIADNNLNNSIYFYGSCPDVKHILSQCEIGVLSSKSEGLPIALLEYGQAGLAVIATNVGDCNLVINSNEVGQLIESENEEVLQIALNHYISDIKERNKVAMNLNKRVDDHYSQQAVIDKLKEVYSEI